MIYGFTLWEKVFPYLLKELPLGSIRNISDFNKMKKMASKEDLLFFLRFGKGATKLLKEYKEENFNIYPNPEFAVFISNRIEHLKEVDKITKFPLKRQSYSNIFEVDKVPNLSNKVVMKVGNFHCGENKWLLPANSKQPFLKHKLRKEPVLFEEFVPNARSIRIGIVGKPKDDNSNIYIAEHRNSEYAANNTQTSWIKNIAPIEETYLYDERHQLNIDNIDELIEETKMLANKYDSDLLGVDWVISEEKTGLLELNDMIGIPDDERVVEMFQRHILDVCLNYLEKQENM